MQHFSGIGNFEINIVKGSTDDSEHLSIHSKADLEDALRESESDKKSVKIADSAKMEIAVEVEDSEGHGIMKEAKAYLQQKREELK